MGLARAFFTPAQGPRPTAAGLGAFSVRFNLAKRFRLAAMSTAAEWKRKRALNCERQRRQRDRENRGRKCYLLEVDDVALAEALIASGRRTEEETQRRVLVHSAVIEIINDFIERWRPEN
jgi:hypothetical protein